MLGGQMVRLNRSARTLTWSGRRLVHWQGPVSWILSAPKSPVAGGRLLHHQSLLVAQWQVKLAWGPQVATSPSPGV